LILSQREEHACATGSKHRPFGADWVFDGAIIGLKDGTNSFVRLERIRAADAAVSGSMV
jgi:hypothetical protein